MKKSLLKVEKLWVKGNGKEILKGVNLLMKKGEIKALVGPNASGKSTLANVILGNPKYRIEKGKIFFEGKDITRYSPEKRVKLGIALSWQSPPNVKGVKLGQLLERISKVKVKLKEGEHLLKREINVDFSGGEKKISELIQILSLCPKLVILDEIDSGLDIKRLERVAKIIKQKLIKNKISILLITHQGEILNYLKPDLILVMVDGKIICQSKNYKKVLKVIKKYGYEKCKKCKFLTG
jgi:Fe-S cluster assembly ATP-binding protein